MFYSKSTGWFYKAGLHDGAMPDDVVAITEDHHTHLLEGEAKGLRIKPDAQGFPQLVEAQPDVAALLERAKDELRTMRRDILDAVTGIGFRANVAGNSVLAQESAQVSQLLLDITDDPVLNTAQSYEEMRAAGVAAFRRVAAGASPAFAATFKEFTGA